MSLWIKICGNTSLEDALFAADSGADAVGFVFAPSPRRVAPEQAAAIVTCLPETVEKIGVFVDAALDEIESTVRACALTGVQLHFNAAPELPAKLHERLGPQLRILRVIHFKAWPASESIGSVSGQAAHHASESFVSGHDFSRAEDATGRAGALAPEACLSDPHVDAVLVDSLTTKAVGGAGVSFDWAEARKTVFRDAGKLKLIAAGGLTPSNVAEAIATLRPWGVDVVSGVEAGPGRKDPAKVREFIARARATRTSRGESKRGQGRSS